MSSVINVFNEYYKRYDQWYIRNLNIAVSERLCVGMLAPYGLILDIGVGTGFLTRKLSKTMIGIDPAEKPLLLASSRGFLTINGFGEELPFRSNVFDTILLIVTLCFTRNPCRVLREAYRVLKKNGKIITCIVPRDSPWGQHYIMLKTRGENIFYEHARFYTLSELEDMIRSTGFTVKRYCSTLTYPPKIPSYIEYPILDKVENAGFVCIEAYK